MFLKLSLSFKGLICKKFVLNSISQYFHICLSFYCIVLYCICVGYECFWNIPQALWVYSVSKCVHNIITQYCHINLYFYGESLVSFLCGVCVYLHRCCNINPLSQLSKETYTIMRNNYMAYFARNFQHNAVEL